MANTTYDPKLREAMDEIEQICRKYDIGAYVALGSKTHSEFKFLITHMSWSNIRFLKKEGHVHVKLYNKTEKAKTNQTIALMYSFKDLCALGFGQAEKFSQIVEQHAVVEHVKFGKHGITNEGRDEIPSENDQGPDKDPEPAA